MVLSFSSFLTFSLPSRRVLRTETRWCSAAACSFFTKALRRSSVSGGMGRRMILPSLDGLRPRSEIRIALSIGPICEMFRSQLLHQSLAALLGERRNGQANDLAVVGRVEAQVGNPDRPFDRPDLRNVPGLDGDQRRFRDVQVGNLVEWRRGAVVIHPDMIQNAQ